MSIYSAMRSATVGMQSLDRAIGIVQNNVGNSSTPGYARLVQTLNALPFNPDSLLSGGVGAGDTLSMRNRFAEESVRRQQTAYGNASQRTTDLTQLESVFPISENTGIPGALQSLYDSFSALSVTPNDITARQTVIDRAEMLTTSFRDTAGKLSNVRMDSERSVSSLVSQVNSIVDKIGKLNLQKKMNSMKGNDFGTDSQLYSALDDLSALVDINVVGASDGSVTVFMNGQTPLVIGEKTHHLSTGILNNQMQILDEQGNDLAPMTTNGALGGALQTRNTDIPGFETQLNTLAMGVADTVNNILAGGVDLNGNAPTVPLFTYDVNAGAAGSIAISGITPDQLAAATAAAPGGNGNALQLAALAQTPEIGGFTFSQYYGDIAGSAGRLLNSAQNSQDTQEQLLTQAQSLRQEVQGVNLDDEAAVLLQLQRGYEALAKVISVLDELTGLAIDMVK